MNYWTANKSDIYKALDTLDEALDEYDEEYGLGNTDILEKFEDVSEFLKEFLSKL